MPVAPATPPMKKDNCDERTSAVKGGWPRYFDHAVKSGVYNSRLHPGFQAVQAKIAKKEGISEDRAGAILAAASRGASPAAKKANPRLKRVKGY